MPSLGPGDRSCLDLVAKIEEAGGLGDLEYLVPCDIAENDYFIFNNICKLYFEYLPDADAIRLLHFEFNVYGM